jgi:hypothetical protein
MQSLNAGVSTEVGPGNAKHFEFELAKLLHAGRVVTYVVPPDQHLVI